jgi:hypothetical protein
LGRTDQPLRREVRPHGVAQTSRGHWRDAFGRNSCLDGTSVLCRNVSRMLRHRDAVSDREGLRPPERRDGSGSRGVSASREMEQPVSGGRLPRSGLEWHCHFGANPERARLRSSFLGVLRVRDPFGFLGGCFATSGEVSGCCGPQLGRPSGLRAMGLSGRENEKQFAKTNQHFRLCR